MRGINNKIHGMSKTRIYSIWKDFRRRCNNQKGKDYPKYGGRGISVCETWEDFKTFYAWAMNNGYDDTLSIERIDVNGNYEPENCTFIPKNHQTKNQRRNYSVNGMCLSDAARLAGLPPDTVGQRVRSGWLIEKALTTPLRKRQWPTLAGGFVDLNQQPGVTS